MLLQERNYHLYHDGKIEDEVKSHQLLEHRTSSSSIGLSDNSTYAKTSPPDSLNNRLRRSTFDLSSVNSLATSCSDESSCCLPSPSRKISTLRYRGRSSSSLSSSGDPSSSERAVSRASLHRAANKDTKSTLQEDREEQSKIKQSVVETQWEDDFSMRRKTSATTSTNNSPISAMVTTGITSSHSDCTSSFMQYFLEVILFGCLVVPFLQLTITIERYLRSIFGDLQRLVFASLLVTSASFQQEPINFDGERRYPLSNTSLQQGLFNANEDISDASEAICCYSSSSSSSDDDNTEGEQDGWGHFADFRDELADEASFIPSSCCVNALETLAEGREEDDDVGEDWSF